MLRLLGFTLAMACAAAPSGVLAQTFPTDEMSAATFRPSPGARRYLMVDGAQVGGHEAPPVGAMFDYAYRPLYVRTFCGEADVGITCDLAQGDRVAIVEHLVATHLFGSYAFGDRVEVGLSLPVVFASGEGFSFRTADSVGSVNGGSGGGLGDPRLSVQTRLMGTADDPWALAVVVWGTAPLGQATAGGRYVGDGGPNVGGHAVGELYVDQLRAAVTLGGYYRPEAGLIGVDVGPMMSYGAAAEWRASSVAAVVAEVTGSTSFGASIDQLEGRAAGTLRLGDFEVTAGAGLGLVRGPGVPIFRTLAGLRWAPLPAEDQDGDGVPDETDSCPNIPEDADGFADEDGCPEEDNDGDRIADGDDGCPDQAEDMDGHEDEDGCPEEDNDGDGVPDGYDSCPDTPEDMDGDRDHDGCPDNDRDDDGVDDAMDRCPDEPEDTDGLADRDGCPETDADGDGVLDEDDVCPEVAGEECSEEERAPAPEPEPEPE